MSDVCSGPAGSPAHGAPPIGRAELKLSKLQRFMLEKARENHIDADRAPDQPDGADLYTSEVLAGFYGFKPRAISGSRHPRGAVQRTIANASQIRTAEAAISRAARRLEERGLIVRCTGTGNSAGIRLTCDASPGESR